MHGLFHALTDKRADERVVSYVESHDQALAFWRGGLVFASEMYAMPACFAAAQKLADFYEARYTGYDCVYWGGSLDASCEDKEGAMAAEKAAMRFCKVVVEWP